MVNARNVDAEFLNCYRSNNRKFLLHKLLNDIDGFSQLSAYDKIFVLRICIHKVKEGKV